MEKGENFRLQLECENDNNDDTMLLLDGLDEAIIGHTDSWNGAPWGRRKFIVGRPHRAVYDRGRCISILEEKGKISKEEVEQNYDIDEDMDYMDENGPIFVRVFKRKDRRIGKGSDFRSQFEEITGTLLDQSLMVYGFEDALIGYTVSFMGMNYDMELLDESDTIGRPTRLVYDRDQCIRLIKKRDSVNLDEATQKFEDRFESEYLGASTPVFVTALKRRKDFG
jgi:hypothetical protein